MKMQTPWGDVRVNDAHVHFFSPNFFSLLAPARSPAELSQALGWELPERPEDLAQRWVNELDRHGVARTVLIASIPGDEGSVARAISLHPDRFLGYFMLNPLAPDAVARCESALGNGLRGICLFPAMHRFSMHDAAVTAVLDLAKARPGTIVFVHCGVLTVGIRKKLGLPSPFDMRYSNPIDLHAVALRYPEIRFVVPHFGAGYFREALMLCDLCPNVYLDTSSTNSWVRYQDEGINLQQAFRRALDVAGPGRLLFGSDSSFFPRGWHAAIFEEQARLLKEIGISQPDAARIFGGNLEALLSRK